MTIKESIKDANYEFTDGTYTVRMEVDFEEGQYTLSKVRDEENGSRPYDYDWVNVCPIKSRALINLLGIATDRAIEELRIHKACAKPMPDPFGRDTYKTSLGSPAVEFPTHHVTNETDGADQNNSNPSHSDGKREGI